MEAKKIYDNHRWSQLIGSILGICFVFGYLRWGEGLQSGLLLFGVQLVYLQMARLINQRFGKIAQSRLSYIPRLVFIVPGVFAYLRFPLNLALLVWVLILIVLWSYQRGLGEAQGILLFFMYNVFTSAHQLVYGIIGLIFYGGLFGIRMTETCIIGWNKWKKRRMV